MGAQALTNLSRNSRADSFSAVGSPVWMRAASSMFACGLLGGGRLGDVTGRNSHLLPDNREEGEFIGQ